MGRGMIIAIIVYLVIALIMAGLVMFGYYTFNYTISVRKSKLVIEWIKAIFYGLCWPIWLVVAVIDEIKD